VEKTVEREKIVYVDKVVIREVPVEQIIEEVMALAPPAHHTIRQSPSHAPASHGGFVHLQGLSVGFRV
jgi:hypothetical protein